MKNTIKITWLLLLLLAVGFNVEAQLLKKIKKSAEEAAKETILRKVEEKSAEETEKAMDSILEAPGKKGRKKNGKTGQPTDENGEIYEEEWEDNENTSDGSDPEALYIYSKFDFVPGDKLIFFDDLSREFVGDFPSQWNTNGSGEVVATDEGQKKWLEIKPGYGITYIPDVPDLPEDYTVEFDMLALGLDRQTASTAVLKVGVSNTKSFKWGKFANVDIPFCQYAPVGFFVRNGGEINNSIQGDIREKVLGQPHISIAVNKQRFRLWVDEKKVVDIPRMIPEGSKPVAVKFELHQFKDGKERLFISNLKVAEGGQDLRRQLIEEGTISTNAILFESGSATLLPVSMGVIRQISQVLNSDETLTLNIIGHTDADGAEEDNLTLSEERAWAVKNALISVYAIEENRLMIEGRGASEPVAENTTLEGKARNRRVEFVKM
ncbi:MAG: OmpA family protein [Flavobacteriaceae bacterium]|nr:OmpA family protein [Muriicola sp.]NNC62453.1 OmpA family protein [Eudoraea sp.]NNK11273.1 OmpA family protein [Flavobacteriaceae bacterium]MBT8290093.1 OmpA family protein [Muriicola sp.]NNK35287.1 OmpA family protein [Eudoraea sp.]